MQSLVELKTQCKYVILCVYISYRRWMKEFVGTPGLPYPRSKLHPKRGVWAQIYILALGGTEEEICQFMSWPYPPEAKKQSRKSNKKKKRKQKLKQQQNRNKDDSDRGNTDEDDSESDFESPSSSSGSSGVQLLSQNSNSNSNSNSSNKKWEKKYSGAFVSDAQWSAFMSQSQTAPPAQVSNSNINDNFGSRGNFNNNYNFGSHGNPSNDQMDDLNYNYNFGSGANDIDGMDNINYNNNFGSGENVSNAAMDNNNNYDNSKKSKRKTKSNRNKRKSKSKSQSKSTQKTWDEERQHKNMEILRFEEIQRQAARKQKSDGHKDKDAKVKGNKRKGKRPAWVPKKLKHSYTDIKDNKAIKGTLEVRAKIGVSLCLCLLLLDSDASTVE